MYGTLAPMTTLGATLEGRYRLDALIGAGGMATVYRARDLRLERDVAVKLLSTNFAADPGAAARFEREARAMAAMHHPALVAIHDVGSVEGVPYLVMELVDGISLAERLRRSGPLDPDALEPILLALAGGLQALHDAGFVHRDVKPDNVMLARDGTAKLTDFGLVRGDASATMTAPGTTVGTLGYLAPELLRGEPATPASDDYALGALVYRALTGCLPYPDTTIAGLVEAQAGPPTPPSTLAPWLGPSFDGVLLAALGTADARPDAASLATGVATAAAAWRAAGSQPPPEVAPTPIAAPAAAEAATIAMRPSSPTIAIPPTGRRRRRGLLLAGWLGGAALGLAALGVLFGLLGLLGGRGGGGGGSNAGGLPTTAITVTTTPTPLAPPSPTVQPTPSPTPTNNPLAAAMQALDGFNAIVADLSGGPDGLKGRDARSLTSLANQVQAALDAGNLSAARDSAQRLLQQTGDAARGLPDQAAAQLRAAAAAVVDAVVAIPSPTGGDG